MPVVYTVSELKKALSGILSSHTELQNIKARGILSPNGNDYVLSNSRIGIRCFMTHNIKAQFSSLLTQSTSVVISGKITLHTSPQYNEYQITVSDITTDIENATVFGVDQIESQLLNIITGQSEFADVHIMGEINNTDKLPNNISVLSDSSDSAILCQFKNNVPLDLNKEKVHVRGKIRNYSQPRRIQYQIGNVEILPLTDVTTICLCLGCESCQLQGGNQACPPLQNPKYELCSSCYNISPDREDRIAHAVYTYFDALAGNGFSPQKEQKIRMGSEKRKADVVLVNGNESFAAIAECKGAGFVGHGIEQLQSYLSATDSPFGIFANRVDPKEWKFYKNLGKNQFDEIKYDQFKEEIKELTDCDRQTVHSQIQRLESEKEQLEKIHRNLKKQFDKVKDFLQSAKQKIDQASEVIDE